MGRYFRYAVVSLALASFVPPCFGDQASGQDANVIIMHSDNAGHSFSMVVPDNWRVAKMMEDESTVGLWPLLHKKHGRVPAAPNYNVMIIASLLPEVLYSDGRRGYDMENSPFSNVEALEKDMPRKHKINTAVFTKNPYMVYKKANTIHIVRRTTREKSYSAYIMDGKRKTIGEVTLVVSGGTKSLYASYVKDLQKVANSFVFLD